MLGPLDDAIAEQMKADVLAVCRVPPPHQAKGFTILPEKLSAKQSCALMTESCRRSGWIGGLPRWTRFRRGRGRR